jgi:hypothetical protein
MNTLPKAIEVLPIAPFPLDCSLTDCARRCMAALVDPGDDVMLAAGIGRSEFSCGHRVQFVPGLGPVSTFGRERLHNPPVADRLFGSG